MPETDLINESLRLMAIGMGIVFSFLLLLVLLLRVMSWLAAKLAPDTAAESGASATMPAFAATGASESELIAVISAAVGRYRARHQR
jgi:oxaloacetate decarboxylase gamma subunit